MRAKKTFGGIWRIAEMGEWDRDDFELLGPAWFTFGPRDGSEFRFIAVEGAMDCRYGERDGRPGVEFTWEGHSEYDPMTGRGWAVLDGDEIQGHIFFQQGDDSTFRAVRGGAVKTKARKQSA
jgi:hypothetical protein